MFKKQLFATIMAILLTACSTSPTPFLPTVTSHPTLPPGVTPSATASPTVTPSPTPTPGVRLVTADQAFFDGDYINAQLQYQTALSNTNDPAIIAASLWGLGRVEYAAGNNGKALIDLTNLSTSYPGEPNAVRAYFLLGEIYMALERYPEAAQAYSTYLKLRPGVLDSFVQERRGDAYNSAGNFTEAISAYKTALAAPHIGDDTALQIKIAQAVASSGDSTTALSMYDSISKASSDADVKAQMDLFSGRIDLALGQPSQAYQFFLDAVNNYPTSPDSYSMLVALVNNDVPVDDLNRGLVDYSAGQYGYARDAFQRYIDTNPKNDGTAAFYNAMTFVQLGDYQQGLSELTNFINSYPSNKNWQTAWGEKADIQWSELGDYPAAAQTYLDYAKANPDILFAPQALEDAGRNYERANNLEQAARTWESIADTYPGSNLVPQVLFWAGIARYRAATYSQALVTFQRDLQLSTAPDDQARAYFWIGKTQQTLGDGASAQSAWQQATLLDPTDYYSLRSQDMLLKRPAFAPPPATNFNVDLSSERDQAEAWLRVTFNLPINTDLSTAGALLSDPRLVRGTELWNVGLQDEARLEFEDLRISIQNNPADTYRLANYMLTLGLYRPAITAMRQVLTLAGMNTQAQTLAAPAYFNHVRYGLYYQDLVMPVAQQAGFDPLFLFSVIREESLFEGFVQSDKGARGLMQIIPSTGQGISDNLGWPPNYTSDDLYRPLISIGLGASYLAQQRVNFNGDLFAALAAYNAGPSAAPIWSGLSGPDADLFLEVIRISQTSDYIRSIYEIYSMYRTLYGVVP
jgi:soluble lytic murein transglycosylase